MNAAANIKAPLFNMTLSILQVTILVRAWSTNGAGVKIECCDKNVERVRILQTQVVGVSTDGPSYRQTDLE